MVISVERIDDTTFLVLVDEGGTSTSHDVTVTQADLDRLAPGTDPERLVRASFEFLLSREPKEAILRHFALPVIERYFPDYPLVIRTLVDRH
jgi:hypothetical protein